MRPDFRYYFFSANKKPLYVDGNGIVLEGNDNYQKPDGQPATLQYSPTGWKETLVKYGRNAKWWGVTRDMTAPMDFVNDGADILRDQYYNHGGVEAIVSMGIQKLLPDSLPYQYTKWYLTEINFPKFEDSETSVKVEALEGGLSKYLKANENTQYEIPLDTDPEAFKVYMDGADFQYTAEYFFMPTASLLISPADFQSHLIDISLVSAEAGAFGETFSVPYTDVNNDNAAMRASGAFFHKVDVTGPLKFEYGNLTALVLSNNPGAITPGTDLVIQVRAINASNATTATHTLFQTTDVTSILGANQTITGNGTINVTAGDELYLIAYINPNLNNSAGITIEYSGDEAFFKVTYTYRHDPSYIWAIYPARLLELLVKKMTDGQYLHKSTWLAAKKDVAITCGDSLRGFVTTTGGAVNTKLVLKTSFADLFKFLFSRFCVGCGIENEKLVIEPLSYFFKTDVILNLGTVTGAKCGPAEDLMFSKILAGYKEQEYKDVNGRYEVNQGQQWAMPVTKIVKDLDLTSGYRTDPIGAELLRINFDKKKSTDTSSDNDVFALHINTAPQAAQSFSYYTLARPAYTATAGLLSPTTIYNVEFSPKRGILNCGPYLRSILPFMDSKSIKFISADKNSDLSTTLAGVTITEKEDIQIGSLPDKLFDAHYFTFTTEVPINLMPIMEANPYGRVQFEWNGLQWYGFLWDGGLNPATNEKQTWKLLAAPNQNLSKFNGK